MNTLLLNALTFTNICSPLPCRIDLDQYPSLCELDLADYTGCSTHNSIDIRTCWYWLLLDSSNWGVCKGKWRAYRSWEKFGIALIWTHQNLLAIRKHSHRSCDNWSCLCGSWEWSAIVHTQVILGGGIIWDQIWWLYSVIWWLLTRHEVQWELISCKPSWESLQAWGATPL